ncbi:GNAT family protein [Clostridium sp.]|uniref:GNAT family N-acetyltransferase n=1 Tax=Clostridium sp. TaxID=1506 RepID=UPI002849FC45|nr:GNAT family protein [Clostridium sp.]MDR3598350.1 GNAT family protein [Clostridium sp.]
MIKISLLEKEDFNKVVEWNKDKTADDLLQWAGPMYNYPLTVEQIDNYFTNEVKNNEFNIYVYKIKTVGTNEAIGTIELREIDKNKRVGMICRFLIGEEKNRGKGIGQEVLKEILKIGFENMKFEKVALRVFDFNNRAIRCYENLGFKKENFIENARKTSSSSWNIYDMAILKGEWEKEYLK